MCKDCKEMVEKFRKELELKTKTADIYVRKHTYESIGVAAGVAVTFGLVIGYLFGKHKK